MHETPQQTPFLDADVLVSAWGLPSVTSADPGFPQTGSSGSAVWMWQFFDKRVIARVQIWPIRKSKPFVEKLEVQQLPQSENRS
jgi:hypothetical protein